MKLWRSMGSVSMVVLWSCNDGGDNGNDGVKQEKRKKGESWGWTIERRHIRRSRSYCLRSRSIATITC